MLMLHTYRIAVALLTLVLFVPPLSGATTPLTTATEIRALTPEQGQERLPLRLDGVVTFYHPEWGVLFLHDGHDGICVGVPEAMRPAQPFEAGANVHVEGIVGPGEFLPVIWPDSIQVNGTAPLPEYRRVTAEDLFTPALDCHPVEVQAVVKGTSLSDQYLVLDLQIDGWPIRALLPQRGELPRLPWQLLERRVRVHGIVGTHFNDQRQMSGRLLFVAGLDGVIVEEDTKSASAAPLLPVDGLLRVNSPLRQRARVRGHATHVLPGEGLYLRGEGGSLFVKTAQLIEINREDEVEAEGFPLVTPFRPSLSALDVKRIGEAKQVEAIPFHPADQRNSREQCELVTLAADVLDVTPGREASTLLCRSDGEVFEALLPSSAKTAELLTAGMKLKLTGICELVSTRPLVIPRNATSFRVLLRDAADITVLARQPWWNEQRAKWVLGSLGLLALAIGAWAVTLQLVVRSQSNVIRQQAQQQATLEERQRIARDLHDTLEQELVGVNMLLDSTAMKLNGDNGEAAEPLTLARRLLRRAREESRSTIRELRSVALEQRGLPAALDELLRLLATAGGAAFAVEITGTPVRLSGTLETNLLRIAQEAVANASHHAAARRIDITLDYTPHHVTLVVRDDGCGFDPATATSAEDGHFGLSGMKERVEKIAGRLQIESKAGEGTSVSVTAPAIAFASPASPANHP